MSRSYFLYSTVLKRTMWKYTVREHTAMVLKRPVRKRGAPYYSMSPPKASTNGLSGIRFSRQWAYHSHWLGRMNWPIGRTISTQAWLTSVGCCGLSACHYHAAHDNDTPLFHGSFPQSLPRNTVGHFRASVNYPKGDADCVNSLAFQHFCKLHLATSALLHFHFRQFPESGKYNATSIHNPNPDRLSLACLALNQLSRVLASSNWIGKLQTCGLDGA